MLTFQPRPEICSFPNCAQLLFRCAWNKQFSLNFRDTTASYLQTESVKAWGCTQSHMSCVEHVSYSCTALADNVWFVNIWVDQNIRNIRKIHSCVLQFMASFHLVVFHNSGCWEAPCWDAPPMCVASYHIPVLLKLIIEPAGFTVSLTPAAYMAHMSRDSYLKEWVR